MVKRMRRMEREKSGLKPMFVEVPPDLHRAVKVLAAQEGTSIRALIAEGMRRVTAPRNDERARSL
jgi:predicted HicB family RNase H-like nuclease